MHRTFDVSLTSDRADRLIAQLQPLDQVVGIARHRDGSVKPVGDLLILSVLNRGSDDVLRRIAATCEGSTYSIATAEQTSLIDPEQDAVIEKDYDEAIWEEIETGLRHNGHITDNYLVLMGVGGVVAAVGLVSQPAPQAIAFVAAAVIAPGFDPLAKIALGIALRKPEVIWRGVRSTLAGYSLLVVLAGLAFFIMNQTGGTSVEGFTANPEVKALAEPTTRELLLSICGSLAGGVMVASYRESFIAGALMALAFIHAAAMIGVGLACGEWHYALEGLERFGLDMALIVGGCWLVFTLKQALVHKRKPIV